MLKGIEFLLKKSRTFKTLSHTLPSLRVKRCNGERQGEIGRSMIEMLGVLAIIAVLSVAGIAGYSKAMEKWKHDKWKAQITDLVFSAKDAYKNERKYGNPDENILPTLQQIGAVPQSMLDKNNRDIFGNYVSVKIEITWLDNGTNLYRFALFLEQNRRMPLRKIAASYMLFLKLTRMCMR